MKERPILFSAPMVRALLAGTKTQTRRVVKLPHSNPLGKWEALYFGGPNGGRTKNWDTIPRQMAVGHSRTGEILACPYGQPGDRLWVREAFVQGWPYDPVTDRIQQFDASGNKLPLKTWYRADGVDVGWCDEDGWEASTPWKSSIHMPRAASRITLEVTGVRVERLQDISEADAAAEGVHTDPACPAYDAYQALWEQINGKGSWDANPWVWALDFKHVAQEGGAA